VESDALWTQFFEVILIDVAYCLFLEILPSKRGGEAKKMRVTVEETRREGRMDGARVLPSALYVLAKDDSLAASHLPISFGIEWVRAEGLRARD
jgi:hypothetical protein